MKKEQVLQLMTAIDPGLIEESDIQAPTKRRLPKLVRTGLIAACLCLALIGTAAAVHYSGVRTEAGEDGTVWFKGGIAQYPYALFSDELKALEGEAGAKAFNSWQEMEDFIGFDLVNNPLLDANPSPYTFSWSESVIGRCILSISAGQDRMYTRGMFNVDGFDVTLEGSLYTDHIPDGLKDFYENEWDPCTIGVMYQEDGSTEEIAQEFYTTPSGLDVQIVTKMQEDGFCVIYAGFSINGAAYTISIPCHSDGGQAVLIQVLDSFVLPE